MIRPPDLERKEIKPVIIATIRTTVEAIPFAKICSYGMRYYNNALFAPEIKGGASATVANELKDWPYWYMHTNIQDSTGNPRQKKGFDTTGKSRDSIFHLIKEWILDFPDNKYPYIPDEPLLTEIAEAIVTKSAKGEKDRCDHTEQGTLDSTICFGILLYVFKNAADQIRCNFSEVKELKKNPRAKSESKTPCGMMAMGYGNKQI